MVALSKDDATWRVLELESGSKALWVSDRDDGQWSRSDGSRGEHPPLDIYRHLTDSH